MAVRRAEITASSMYCFRGLILLSACRHLHRAGCEGGRRTHGVGLGRRDRSPGHLPRGRAGWGMLNHNVRLALVYTLLYYVAASIAIQSVFSSYVYILTNGSNSKVGYITGLSGLAQVLTAPFSGYLADKHRRDRLLGCSGFLGVLVSTLTFIGVYYGHFPLLCACLACWGVVTAVQNPAMEALFADSIEPGRRSLVFAYKYALLQIAYAAGPLCSMVMFHYLGDDWSLSECKRVIMVGTALAVLPAMICFFFNDDKALGGGRSSLTAPLLPPPKDQRTLESIDALTACTASSTDSIPTPPRAHKLQLHDGRPTTQRRRPDTCGCCCSPRSFCRRNLIPIVIALTDVSFGLASGMSVRFFPLFFQNVLHLSPAAVSLIYVISPLATSISSYSAQRVSPYIGRIGATLAFKMVGISLLYLMCWLQTQNTSWAVLVPIWILRTATMNSSKPLTRSIIMDAVPKDSRAKWNAVESVTVATWSGSAVLGGILVDRYGYFVSNMITATTQLLATIPLFMIAGMVPAEGESVSARRTDVGSDDSLDSRWSVGDDGDGEGGLMEGSEEEAWDVEGQIKALGLPIEHVDLTELCVDSEFHADDDGPLLQHDPATLERILKGPLA